MHSFCWGRNHSWLMTIFYCGDRVRETEWEGERGRVREGEEKEKFWKKFSSDQRWVREEEELLLQKSTQGNFDTLVHPKEWSTLWVLLSSSILSLSLSLTRSLTNFCLCYLTGVYLTHSTKRPEREGGKRCSRCSWLLLSLSLSLSPSLFTWYSLPVFPTFFFSLSDSSIHRMFWASAQTHPFIHPFIHSFVHWYSHPIHR